MRHTKEQLIVFIQAWWRSDSIQEAANKTWLDRRGASDLAKQLRKMGIPMKHFKGSTGPKKGCKELTRSEIQQLLIIANKEQAQHKFRQDVAEAEKVRARVNGSAGKNKTD